MIQRAIADKVAHLATKFPVVTLTGIRQCGKSTLLRNSFPDYRYVSLENPDMKLLAQEDPNGFLKTFPTRTIIGEAQNVPQLFSYLQTHVDAAGESGMYLLSGSHIFLLMERVTQSLAGRAAVLRLTPFSARELAAAGLLPATVDEWLFAGGFPRLYDKQIAPADYFPSYIQTYIERDVRALKNIGDLTAFVRFLKLCAARVGQLLNLQSLANEAGISVKTANEWLSVLQTSNVVFLLRPYYRNFNKRLTKTPKLYFYDTGLVASLLGLTDSAQLNLHYLRGALFENMVVTEKAKASLNAGAEPQIYFWRDSNQNEVDLLCEEHGRLHAYEIKSGSTLNPAFYKGLIKFAGLASLTPDDCTVVYGGDLTLHTSNGTCLSWREL